MRIARLLALSGAAAVLGFPALAQDTPDSVVFGRQILMDEIEAQLTQGDLAGIGESFDIDAGRIGAAAASAMLGVVPYLFPEGTDEAATADSDFPSLAKVELWRNFEAFRAMANQAAQMAFDLSQETDEAEFRGQSTALRAVCNACHALYMHVDDTPL